MYSYTTGGPFGLEEMVTTSGPGLTLIYHLVLPLFWCLPISLVSAELTTAMPVEGGFYRWVRTAFGNLWGFLAGWWNWSASFLLGSAYAVLFTDYLTHYFPQIIGWKHYAVSVALIALITWINVRGIQLVGKFATALEVFIILPILVMIGIGLVRWHHNPFVPLVPPHQPLFKVFGVGLALGVWLYSGYEQVSSVAEEVENPQRSYPLALSLVLPLSILTYFLPTFAALAALGNWQDWRTGYFPEAAQLIAGPWLGNWVTLSAMVTNLALLNSTVLTTTRMPFAMAEDGYLPSNLTRVHSRYGTPALAIVVSAVVYAVLAFHSLSQLINVYVWLRVATSLMTVLAAWKLRDSRPDMPRPFFIPWGGMGLLYVVGAPLVMSYVVLRYSDPFAIKWGPLALLVGPVVYYIYYARKPNTRPILREPKSP